MILTEEAPGLDRLRTFSRFSVRTCLRFGQTLDFFCISCPNLPQIRTDSGPFLSFLSELALDSDRLWTFPAFPVRTCLRFGQTRAFFCLSCPNLPWIRTDSGLFLAFLSELAPGSGNNRQFPAFPVRTSPHYFKLQLKFICLIK